MLCKFLFPLYTVGIRTCKIERYCATLDLTYNTKKTICMFFSPIDWTCEDEIAENIRKCQNFEISSSRDLDLDLDLGFCQVPQIRPLADIVHSKHLLTHLLTYLLTYCIPSCITHRPLSIHATFQSDRKKVLWTDVGLRLLHGHWDRLY